MNEPKTEVLNLRMSARLKALLRAAAAHERRTLSNMLEVLIEDYCRDKKLVIEAEVRAVAPKRPLTNGTASSTGQ
jgi:uncharacterized protein (DUF1778 family)